MSGIEVAGIALAVLPLFISAWEHYETGLSRIGSIWQWDKQLPGDIRSLRDQRCLFEYNLDRLLAEVTTPEERESLLDGTFSSVWKDADIQAKIRDKLGKALDPFESNMARFLEICKNIAEGLDLDLGQTKEPDAVTQDSLQVLLRDVAPTVQVDPSRRRRIQLKKRLKYAWSKKRIKALTKELEKINSLLEKLVDRVSQTELTPPKVKKTAIGHLHLVHNQACRLLRVLTNAWPCTLHTSHLAGIQLEKRLGPTAKKEGSLICTGGRATECIFFRFAFAATEGCVAHPHRAHFHELEIAVSETEVTVAGANQAGETMRSVPRVNFADPADVTDATAIDAAGLKVVNNICATLAQGDSHPRVGFFFDSSSQSLRGSYQGLDSSDGTFSGDADLVKLKELLPMRKRGKGHRGLTLKQRVVLAVTLASSVLQLHATCFSRDWSKQTISFIRSKPDEPDHVVAVDRPLLVRVFETAEASPREGLSATQSAQSLLSVGALLLELSSGETLEERIEMEGGRLSSENVQTRTLAICRDWLHEERDNLSPAWRQAINFLLCNYINIDADLAEPSFRQAVHDQVVAPLEEDARRFVGSQG